MMKILLNEIFYSIQGEGPNIGKPAVFVRLGGCNLRCAWCDSKFTWDPKAQDNILSTTDDIVQKIKRFPCRRLVITGGEPMLQQKAIIEILRRLPDYTAEIETNGSIPIAKKLEQNLSRACRGIICSPKLTNSLPDRQAGNNKPYALKIKPTNQKVIFKFVVSVPKDIKKIRTYCQKNRIPARKIWLMPQGVTRRELAVRSPRIVEACKKEGYNFTTRLHIMLYGNKRKI